MPSHCDPSAPWSIYHALNQGLALYAAGYDFEAHEIWEHAWMGEVGRTRRVIQALIQVAAAFHKQTVGQPLGTLKLLSKAHDTLAEASSGASAWLGLDLVGLQRALTTAAEQAAAVVRGEENTVGRVVLPNASGPDGLLYLDGFAASPASQQTQFFLQTLTKRGFAVAHFRELAVTGALQLARRHLRDRTIVIGSSLGAYLGALLAANDDRVQSLILMAPALDSAHPPWPELRIPTYILQGRADESVPVSVVEAFTATERAIDRLGLARAPTPLAASDVLAECFVNGRFQTPPDP